MLKHQIIQLLNILIGSLTQHLKHQLIGMYLQILGLKVKKY